MNKKMKNQIKEVEIYCTYNYDQFKFYPSNRPPSHWPKIARSIEKRDLTRYIPILVDKNYYIIDGQGRYLACKKMGKPIYYIVGHDLTEEDIIRLNINQTNWSNSDYLSFYIDKGYPDYISVSQILQQCDNLKLTYIFSIWQGTKRDISGKKISTSEMFKSGNYSFPKAGINKCKLVSKILKVIQENVPPNELKRQSSLVSAISSICIEEVDIDRLITQLEKYSHLFKAQGDQPHYKRHLEFIYNYRKREKIAFTYL
jgi:hypothetical protein